MPNRLRFLPVVVKMDLILFPLQLSFSSSRNVVFTIVFWWVFFSLWNRFVRLFQVNIFDRNFIPYCMVANSVMMGWNSAKLNIVNKFIIRPNTNTKPIFSTAQVILVRQVNPLDDFDRYWNWTVGNQLMSFFAQSSDSNKMPPDSQYMTIVKS